MKGPRVGHGIGLSVLVLVTSLIPVVVAQPASAAARIAQSRTKATTSLPASSDPVTVQSVTLGSGPWIVTARAFIVDGTSPENDFFRCELYDATNGKHLDVSAAWVTYQYPGNMLTNVAKLKVAAGVTATIQQRCWHDHDGIASAYVDPGATILAFKASAGSQNRLSRTTAQTSLASTTAITVASLGLSAGEWVYGFKATAVNVTSTSDRANCRLGNKFVSQSVGNTLDWPRAATLAAFGMIAVDTATTITVTCYSSNGGAVYLDPGAVLWARQIPPAVTGDSCETVTGGIFAADGIADMRTGTCVIGFGTGASQTGGMEIPPGKWVVLGAEQAVRGQTTGWIRCRAVDPGNNKVVDKGATLRLIGTNTFYATTTYLGKLTTSVLTSVEFRCGQDGPGMFLASSDAGGYVAFRP